MTRRLFTSTVFMLLSVTQFASAGKIAFKPAQSYAVGTQPISVAVGDFNGDGKPDLAILNNGSSNVSILLGNADGTFQSAGTFAAPISANSLSPKIAIGDFNGDGKPDVAVLIPSANASLYPSEVLILFGNGDGTLQRPVVTTLDLGETIAVVADLNGDKKADLVVGVSDANGATTGLAVLLGNGDGSFQAPHTVMTGQWGLLTVMDFNSDGKLDLVVSSSSTVQIMLGHGDGTFSQGPQAILADGYSATRALAAAVNGDKSPDLIVNSSLSVRSECGTFIKFPCTITTVRASVFSSGTEGQLQGEQVLATASGLDGDAVGGDFNGDGTLDVAMTASDSLSIYQGNTFSSPVSVMAVPAPLSLAADLNGDQLTDLVVLDSANNSVDVFVNATPAFLMTASQAALTATAGEQITDTLSFAGVNGFFSTLQFSCQVTGPAPVPTCSLSPASITAVASASTSTLTIRVPATEALIPSHTRRLPPVYALALPFAFVGLSFRRERVNPRHYKRWLLGASLAMGGLMCTACGGGNSNTQSVHQSQPYMVQVTATSDALTKTLQISLTVQ